MTMHNAPCGRSVTQVSRWPALLASIRERIPKDDLEYYLEGHRRQFQAASHQGDDDKEEDAKTDDIFVIMEQDEDELKTAGRLRKIFSRENLHDDNGSRIADEIDSFIAEETSYREKFLEEHFVGREDDVTHIFDAFTKPDAGTYAVHIWGIGGQGKSAVAKQVCQKLIKGGWIVMKVNLSGMKSIADVYKAVLVESKQDCPKIDDKTELGKMVSDLMGARTSKTLYCLDDCDGVFFNNTKDFKRLLESAMEISRNLRQVYVLFTSRQRFEKASFKEKLTWKSPGRLTRGQSKELRELAEYELAALSETDAVQLFKICAEKEAIRDEVVLEIVQTCGRSPYAIKMASQLVQRGQFTPERLLANLSLDKKNVSKVLHMSDIIKTSIEYLEPELQKALVKLSVFPNCQFDLAAARKIVGIAESESKEAQEILYELRKLHLVECDRKVRAKGDSSRDRDLRLSLHPLVHRYLAEWSWPPELEQAYNDAVRSFMELYEDRISRIVRKLDTKSMKGIEMLHEHTSHVMQFYDILHDKYDLLKPYPRETHSKQVLTAKRVSDLTDLLLSDVKKRRLFQSEADRAKRCGCDAMYVFWMVEKADVLLMLHDKADLALEILDELTNGKYAALRGLHRDRFYPPLVHAMFHKVKGQVFWKKRSYSQALDHLRLALHFIEMHRASVYNYFTAKILCYIGQVHFDKDELEEAEEYLRKGLYLILGVDAEEGARIYQADNQAEFEQRCLQWDAPVYLTFYGRIHLARAKMETDAQRKQALLDKAQQDLTRGMHLDEKLRMNNLDNYCSKRKSLADVYIEKGLLDEALGHAEGALSQRRDILQMPHVKYVHSVYQVAKIYMLKGNKLQETGHPDEALDYWKTSAGTFEELQKHHLINGSISNDDPLVAEIKSDHMEVTRLASTNPIHDLKKLAKFYKDLQSGHYQSEANSIIARFKEMLWTPMETLKNMYGGGGEEFGERDFILQREVELAEEMANDDGRERHDSGRGHSSSDLGESTSSSAAGSIGSAMGKLRLEKSISLEDNVFTGEVPPSAKPEKKRQRTIDE